MSESISTKNENKKENRTHLHFLIYEKQNNNPHMFSLRKHETVKPNAT